MSYISLIASITKGLAIGNSQTNDLIKRDKTDMKIFKARTLDNTVVMGRKTWESLPQKPLIYRKNIILSTTLKEAVGAVICRSVKEVLKVVEGEMVYVIGGGEVYKAFIPFAHCLMLSEWKDESLVGDIKFPTFEKEFKLEHAINYEEFIFKNYKRKL